MKTILISLTAAAALAAAAAPAVAQDWRGQSDYGQRYDQRQDYGRGSQVYGRGVSMSYIDSLDWKITSAERNRVISQREAQQLRAELRQVRDTAWWARTGQASRWDRERLDRSIARIEAAVNRYAANDRRGPNDGYGQRNDWRR